LTLPDIPAYGQILQLPYDLQL